MAAEVKPGLRDPRSPRNLIYTSLLPLLLLLLAFALRVYHLDFQSLWSDEGITLLRSGQPLGQMLRLMPVEHVPGYFVLLNLWLPLAGTGDFALRFPSLIPSVLTVALAYRLGADLGSRPAGLAAALLLATGAFQIWYAQEARMYSWLMATAFGATWFLWRLLEGNVRGQSGNQGTARRPPVVAWIGYVACTAATIYLHHFGFLLPVAHVTFALIWLAATRDWRRFLRWVTAGIAVIVLYLPWVPRFLGIFGFPGWRQPLSPLALPWRYLTAYTAGDPMPQPWHTWLPWVYLGLALAGLWIWWRQNRLAALLLLVSIAVPLTGAVLLALRRPDYHERYTIFISAPLVLLSARGLKILDYRAWFRRGWAGDAARPRRLAPILPALVLAGLVAANAVALYRLYNDPAVQKADYRAAVRRIEQWGQPGDVVLLDGPDPQQIFLHYYHGGLPWRDLRPLLTVGARQVDAALQSATGGARRAWVLRHYHDEGPVQAWLATHAWPATQTYLGGLYFNLYGLPGMAQGEPEQAARPFGAALQLAQVSLAGGNQPASGGTATYRAGDLLGVTTEWQVLGKVAPLKFSLRLADGLGNRWAAEDYIPQAGFAPAENWQPGSTVTDRHALWLPADMPSGSYQIEMVVYEPETGVALDTGSTSTSLARIDVAPAAPAPDPAALPIARRMEGRVGGELAVLGFEAVPRPLHAGQGGNLTVWWQALARPAQAYQMLVQVTNGRGDVAARKLYPLCSASADGWQPGQVTRCLYPLELDGRAPSGTYRVSLSLAGPDGRVLGPHLDLGSLDLEARPRTYRLPTIGHPADFHVGDGAVLRGYDVETPAGTPGDLRVKLYWQAAGPAAANYKVFVHLIDKDGQTIGQSDAIPAGGSAPTNSWLPDEVIVDNHALTVPSGGRYWLSVGMYDPVTGQRPQARDGAGQPIKDGAISLAQVDVP